MSTRIFWNAQERQDLAEASFKLRHDFANHGVPDIELVRRAMQNAIRPDRHRNLITMSNVAFIHDEWKRLKALGNASLQPIISGALNPFVERETVKEVTLSDFSFMDLWGELGKRLESSMSPTSLRSLIKAETNATIDRRMPGIVPPDVEDQPEIKARVVVPKVCVIGLMGDQKELLKRQYGRTVDFHFLEGNEGKSRVKNTAMLMDLTVMSKWCKGMLGSTKDFDNFQSTTGGLEHIRQIINRAFKVAEVTK